MDLDIVEKVRLPEMNGREELVAAYTIQGFSTSGHLLGLYRDRLAREGAIKISQLSTRDSGASVAIGGYNICLQMPPTAKGFAFITLEDEEGLANVVLKTGHVPHLQDPRAPRAPPHRGRHGGEEGRRDQRDR